MQAAASPTEKISAKFPSLEAFLKLPNVDAASALVVLKEQQVILKQLPALSQDDLMKIGIKLGPANRIATAAAKYLAE